MIRKKIAAIEQIVQKYPPYDPANETLMLAMGFEKKLRRPVVVFHKIAEAAQIAIDDPRGQTMCEQGDVLIVKLVGGKTETWSVHRDKFDRTYTIVHHYVAQNEAEAELIRNGFMPCYKSAWQWMQVMFGFNNSVPVQTPEGAVAMYCYDSLVIGVDGEMYPITRDVVHRDFIDYKG